MIENITALRDLYIKKATKYREKAYQYNNRDDIAMSYISAAETYELVINDLNTLIILVS